MSPRHVTDPGSDADPSRMEAAALLAGARPAPAQRCRYLRRGCEEPEELVALALRFPESLFVGVVTGETTSVAEASAIAEVFGLTNIRFVTPEDAPDLGGVFDYIVAPALLSDTPAKDQRKVLRSLRKSLSPRGVALLPFATACGVAWEAPLRAIVRGHLGAEADPAAAAAFARWMADGAPLSDPGHKQRLYRFAENVAAEGTHAVPQRGFDVAQVRALMQRSALQYLGALRWQRDAARAAPSDLISHLSGQDGRGDPDDIVDIISNRLSRQALVCRKGAGAAPAPSAVALHALSVRIRPEWRAASAAAGPPDRSAAITQVWAALQSAEAAGHGAVTLSDLAASVATELRRADVDAATIDLLSAGALEVVSFSQRRSSEPRGSLRLWPLAEMQAQAGRGVLTSRLHRQVVLSETQRALVAQLAERPASRQALVATIIEAALDGRFPLPRAFTDAPPAPDILAEALEASMPAAVDEVLERFVRLGLMA